MTEKSSPVFDDYALDQNSKTAVGMQDALIANRLKMWSKAYAPLDPLIKNAKRILDYGCGAGEFLVYLREKTDAELVGFEISKTQLQAARQRCAKLGSTHLLGQSDEIGGQFDLVFCHHVIEHIADAELPAFVQSLARPLGPKGKLVISTPNGVNPFAYAYYMSTDRTHLRMHSIATLAETLRPAGLEIEQAHRELPQAYDLSSAAKTLVWKMMAGTLKLGILASAAGVRGSRFPLTLAATFYVVAGRASTAADS